MAKNQRMIAVRQWGAALALMVVASGCSTLARTKEQTSLFFDNLSGRTPLRAARKMEDPYFPDERREGINLLVAKEFGRRPPYTTRYRQIAQSDTDFTVRAAAIRALNRSRDRGATPIFINALTDQNELVRLEAAKALINVPDRESIPGLVKIVGDIHENRDVRIAAADALRNYKTLEVCRTLVGTLSGRDFGVAWQSRRSLQSLTGHDLHYDEAAWLGYLTGPDKPFG